MQIPGYKLGRVVETGKASVVYNALDIKRSKTVVVKVYNKTFSENKKFRAHFKRLTSALFDKSLGGNFRFLDAIATSNFCVLVTNYVPNLVRADQRTSGFSKEELLDISRQLAVSLSQLHDLEIVHGGVELSNLYFSEDGDVVLGPPAFHRTMPGNDASDFALQNIHEVACLAPEANRGLTASTDFYSLGVMLYELLIGHKPFDTEKITKLEQQKKSGKYLPLDKEFYDLKPLFDSLLAPEPNFRVSSDSDFDSMLKVYRILDLGSDSQIYSADTEKETDTEEKQQLINERGSLAGHPMILTVLGSSILIVMAIIILLYEKQNDAVMSQPEMPTEQKPEAVTNQFEMEENVESEAEINGFYANARALFAAGDLDAAMLAVDDALKTGVDQGAGQALKAEIELEIDVRSFLLMAEQQFQEGKVILPPGDNAFETYQRIENITAEGDQRATNGMEDLANHFLQIARQQLENKSRDEARKSIIQGLMVSPGNAALHELDNRLKEQGKIENNETNSQDETQSSVKKVNISARTQQINAAFKVDNTKNGLIIRD